MNREVFFAAKIGDLDAIKKLHGQNPRQLKGVTFEGNTVLHIAAKEGHLKLLQWILDNVKGCSGARNADRNTPLHEAAKRGNDGIISALLRYKKCAAAKRNQFGESALLIASEHGHVEAVSLLVEATPVYIILWPRNDRQTCLHVAAYGGHFEIVKLMLERHSFCNILELMMIIHDVHGATPLHAAVHGKNLKIVSEIANKQFSWGFCMNWFGKRLMTKKDMSEIANKQLCWGFCMNWFGKTLMTKKDKFERCAVHIAAIRGDQEMMEVFLSKIPDFAAIGSSDFKTALHFAVEYNQFEIVKKLLPQNKTEEMAELLKYDRDISGNTLLHLAIIYGGDPELVEYLLPFVNVNAINNEGLRAIDKAAPPTFKNETSFTKITGILKEVGASRSFIGNSRSLNSMDFKQESDGVEKIMDVDTLVASLIATVTFAAIFSVPGGIDDKHSGNAPTPGGHVDKQTGVARKVLETLFQVFLFSDSLAMFSSLTVVIAWLFRERFQTKLTADRSLLAKLSVLRLGISSLYGPCILECNHPSHNTSHSKKRKNAGEYELLLWGEILTAFSAPAHSLILLSILWAIEYYFRATVQIQARLRKQLKEALVYIIPPSAVVLGIIIGYGIGPF